MRFFSLACMNSCMMMDLGQNKYGDMPTTIDRTTNCDSKKFAVSLFSFKKLNFLFVFGSHTGTTYSVKTVIENLISITSDRVSLSVVDLQLPVFLARRNETRGLDNAIKTSNLEIEYFALTSFSCFMLCDSVKPSLHREV